MANDGAMRVSHEADERFVRSVLAIPEEIGLLRHEVVFYAQQVGANKPACHNVALAVGEALNNAAMHAYLNREVGPVHVEAWSDGEEYLFVCVLDDGHGMVARADSPGLGLGLPLMARMAEDLHIVTRGDSAGTMVSLKFSLQPPERAAARLTT